MPKDLFPLKMLLRPGEAFSAAAAGRTGWAWPLALYAAAILSSSLQLTLVPASFLAEAAPDFPAAPVMTFRGYLAAGLPGCLLFALFFSALLCAFTKLLGAGRLMFRLPVPAAGVAAYALFFLFRFHARLGPAAGWLAAAAALGFALWSAYAGRREYPALLKAMLAVSLFTVLSNLAAGGAAAAGSPKAYLLAEYTFAFVSLAWLTKAAAAITGVTTARAFAAAVPALLGTAAFFFSLSALGLLGADTLQVLLLM